MNHKLFTVAILIASILLVQRAIDTDNPDLDKVATKIFGMGVLGVAATTYEVVWINRRHDASSKIFSDPVATAVYIGCVWIAFAIAGLILAV